MPGFEDCSDRVLSHDWVSFIKEAYLPTDWGLPEAHVKFILGSPSSQSWALGTRAGLLNIYVTTSWGKKILTFLLHLFSWLRNKQTRAVCTVHGQSWDNSDTVTTLKVLFSSDRISLWGINVGQWEKEPRTWLLLLPASCVSLGKFLTSLSLGVLIRKIRMIGVGSWAFLRFSEWCV